MKRRRRYAAKPSRPTDRHVVADRCGPTRKARYRSRGQAQAALRVIVENGDPRHQERRAYRCPLCDGWHLSKQPPHSISKPPTAA